MNLEAARRLIWTAAWVKIIAKRSTTATSKTCRTKHMALGFTGTAVQRLTEQAIELFGGAGVVQGMPIEKVRA